MEQGSVDWLEWRKQGIGSSDAPVIMGASPYRTPLQLAEEKLGLREPQKAHPGMRRGNELEPKARAAYELTTDVDMPPALFQAKEYPFLRASLDGWNAERKKILEIKCPNKDDHALALDGKIPIKYQWQIQHQFLVTGADAADYFSFDGERGVTVELFPDVKMQEVLLKEELKFWKLIQAKELPEPGPRDFVALEDVVHQSLFEEYAQVDRRLKELEEQKDSLRELILKELQGRRVFWKNVKLYPVMRRGTIDYSKIPALKEVNTEEYRKPSTQSMTLMVTKE